MSLRLLVGVLVVACALPASAAPRGRARLCRQTCGATIEACVAAGGQPRKCKRQIRRTCRREGITVCVPPGTHHVALTGVDGTGCGAPDAPCRTIQFVLDQLIPFGGAGTIRVAAGTFDDLGSCEVGTVANQAVVCIINRQVTLLGGFVPPNWGTPVSDPGATVLDGRGVGRGLRVVRGSANGEPASLTMDGFTIQNGVAQGAASGGVVDTWVFGGGMLVESSALTLRDVVFRQNEARGGTTSQPEGGRAAGGALATYSVWPSVAAPATLANVTFVGNHARGGGGGDVGGYALGGAVFTYGIAVIGDSLVFEDNTATGGSTAGAGTNGTDKGDALGGAFAVQVGGSVDLRHVRAERNVAAGGDAPAGEGGGAFGGAFFAELGELRLTDAAVAQNHARGGAGTNVTTVGSIAQGGGVYATMGGLTLDRVRVVGNEVRAGDGVVHGGVAEGGGVAVTLASRDGVETPFTIQNSVLADNLVSIGSGTHVGGGGGGLFVQGARGTIEHATIASNRLGDPRLLGGGVCLFHLPGWPTQASVTNSILANHSTPGVSPSCTAPAALWVAQNAVAAVTHALFAGNVHDTNAGAGGGCNVPSGAIDMVVVLHVPDAGFVSPAAPSQDYHLTAASPAVDQGAAGSLAMDLDGSARPQGALPDLGAYERVP